MGDVSPICFEKNSNKTYFDEVIGHIEDIVMEEEFQDLQTKFMDANYYKFEDEEENRLIYMDIFREYNGIIETYIVNQLNRRMEIFDMGRFTSELQEKRQHLDGEIFDLILSLLDFVVFKEMIIDYKKQKESKLHSSDFGIIVTKIEETDNFLY